MIWWTKSEYDFHMIVRNPNHSSTEQQWAIQIPDHLQGFSIFKKVTASMLYK